jgi:hypothetical protein
MWKNMLQVDRPEMAIWCKRIACWIPKATNTYSKYVIIVAFPLQQWLDALPQCYVVLTLTRKVKGQCWETFVSRTEHDLHGRQINAYKIIKNLNRTEKDNLQFNPITEHTWQNYYQKLWTEQFNDNTTEKKCAELQRTVLT